ncbi:MAG: hypothetical protein WA080_03600 [Sulfuricurvum sp.]|jgi:NADH:ubiquinone oxidoreductase subunit 6 (subunit J)
MVDVSQPVTMLFIAQTIGAIFVVIAVGIMMVKQAKKKKESV